MYNAMIVDDEPVIRFGLKASINWEGEGLNLLGDFPNGEKALEAMEENRVDILITDIKMPIMDGLTLMKETLIRYPNAKVILVSSYNDFDYAREGLKYGAVDYVLKPTLEPEEFLELIRKCVDLLKMEQAIEDKLHLVEETNEILRRKSLEHQLKKVLLKQREAIHPQDASGFLQQPMMIMYVKMTGAEALEEQYGNLYKSFILDEIQEMFYLEYKEGICIHMDGMDLVVVLPHNAQEPQKLKRWLKDKTSIHFVIGYVIASDIEHFHESVQFSKDACRKWFYQNDENLFPHVPDVPNAIKRLKKDQLKQFLIPYNKQKVLGFLQEHFKQRQQEMMNPGELKDEACDILTYLFLEKMDDVTLLLEKCVNLRQAETFNELYERLQQKIEGCEQIIREQGEKPVADNDLIEKSLHYIHQNFTEELTLQKVANHIHISRNYFSILFKRFLNQNFIDYVIDLRIKKAKELLEHSNMKIYEVAEKSGFRDVKYFSKVFKKLTGFSPGDYRTEQHK